jgi:hypothetical protein
MRCLVGLRYNSLKRLQKPREHNMIRKLNLHWIEWIVVIVLLFGLLFLFAGDSGLAHWIKHGLALVGTGLQWAIGGVEQLVNSVGK